jgi:hypothetical protein
MTDENLPTQQPPDGQFLLYQTEDGQTRIECRFEGETIWLSQANMAELFQVTVPTINEHLKHLYEVGEIEVDPTIRKFLIVRQEGSREVARNIDHYNLDAILSVGYRVRSHRGTQFRIWATERLREFLVKGFAMDDARRGQQLWNATMRFIVAPNSIRMPRATLRGIRRFALPQAIMLHPFGAKISEALSSPERAAL